MACHLVGAMPLSAARDPEDVHDQIVAFHQLAAGIAAQFHGFVAQHQGNGVLIYFGYPAAREQIPSVPCGPALPWSTLSRP